jgi:hypothetical protein
MRHSKTISIVTILLVALLLNSCEPQPKPDPKPDVVSWNANDQKAVKAAIEDYVDGLYLVDSTRIERSVDSTLRKLGYWYNKKEGKYANNLPMTYNQLVRLAARWNSDGDQVDENSPKKIDIYDINTKTASAKLTAAWGIDYFHLGKVNGQWKIFNVMWQSMPETE